MVEQRQIAPGKMTGPAGARQTPPAIVLTPKDIAGILRRHILLMVSFAILGFMVGGASWYLLKRYFPKYTARTFIKVLPPIEKDPMAIVGGQVSKDIQYGNRVSLATIMTDQSTLQKLIDRDKVKETKWFKNFGEVKERSIVKAVDDLKKRFSASAQRDGDYIVVSMTCGDAVESALIVNEMVDLFLASQRSTKRGDVAEKLARLQSQRDNIQRDLDAAERGLGEVRDRWNLTDLETYGGRQFQHAITLRANELEIEQSKLVLEIKELQASIANLQELATGPINEQVENQIEKDPIMLNLAQQLAFMESQLAARLTKLGENHRDIRLSQELINEIREKRQIRRAEIAEQTRQANLKNAQSYLLTLQQKLEELEKMRQESLAKQRELDLARIQYQQRASIRDERKLMLDSVKEQLEKLKIMLEDPETPKVQFVGAAPVPLRISSPRWELYFPGGTVLGLMLGVGLAFLVEILNDLVRTPRDVGRYLQIPLLGIVPDAEEDEQVRDIDLCHVVRQAPYSIISESYRQLKTNLKLSGSEESLKVLLVTSGSAGDGKTSVAVNLATTFVAENKKVLLIDANFWQPALNMIFPREASEAEGQTELGLSTLLVGRCGYQEAVRSSIEGLSVIDSGPLPANPAELLGGAQMKNLIEEQRKNHDYVIIDGPPVLLVSAAKILAKLADGTVLVFNAAATRRGAAQRTITELKEVEAVIAGCVLLGVQVLKGGYFQEQFRSYEEYQKLQLAHSI
ncbi:MAG: polysaccharide biosynthesis tyrosine autokinase [Sedimentisphaerales bacterium]|nr:polysaccharide biosynthesis tyrosine autokinase [Sedimentisphaerales bacterium]